MRKLPPERDIHVAGRELKENPPAQLSRTARKFGSHRAERQRKAIMFSKARKSANRRYNRRRSMRSG